MSFLYHNILAIPDRSSTEKKITKAFFLKHFDLSASEKKTLSNIQRIQWIASIKPSIANIPKVENSEYKYEEIQIIICTVTAHQLSNDLEKIQSLIQKHIPYPILLIIENETEYVINTTHKRINLKDTTKRTIENYYTTPLISKLYKNEITSAFFSSINYSQLDKTNLETTYKSYTKAIIQYQAANITGTYKSRTHKRTTEDMQSLASLEALEKEIVSLKHQIKKENQLNNKVNLNLEIQKKRIKISEIKNKLTQ